jgi:non-ribosomal peptide synthetase component F
VLATRRRPYQTSRLTVFALVVIFSPNHIGICKVLITSSSPILTTSHRLSGGRMGNASARWCCVVCYTRSDIFEPICSSLGFYHRCANPANNTNELLHQLKVAHASLIITHSSSLHTALGAAQAAGLPSERVITFDESNQVSVDSLIQQGLRSEPNFVERRLQKGEAKTKVAFLSFSSGTTGKPKVCLASD